MNELDFGWAELIAELPLTGGEVFEGFREYLRDLTLFAVANHTWLYSEETKLQSFLLQCMKVDEFIAFPIS
jgi:hypothetical protein